MSPANALPLFAVVDVNAYRISESPCGPALFNPLSPAGSTTAIAVIVRMAAGKISAYSMAIWTSRAWIFLPRYSGVRPTMSPAMNTVSTTITSIP